MLEALWRFESTVNSRSFKDSLMVLVFTKTDLLAEKLESEPLSLQKHLPNFSGDLKDVNAVEEFFTRKFFVLDRRPTRNLGKFSLNTTDLPQVQSFWSALGKIYADLQESSGST
jgi:hypothetical protein